MRARSHRRAALVAGLMGALALVALPAVAAADEVEAISLSWDGGAYDTFLSGSLFPSPTVVPGHADEESFLVRNDGPGPGRLTAEIVAVELAGDPGDPFYEAFTLEGRSAVSYLGRDTVILEQDLDAGELTTVAVDFELPVETTVGNHAELGTVQVTFRVRLTLEGSVPDPPTPPGIATTGASVIEPLILGLAMTIAGAGVLLVAKRRTRSMDAGRASAASSTHRPRR